MSSITIKVADDSLVSALEDRAREHGRSRDEVAGELLRKGLAAEPLADNMATRLRARFAPLGGAELRIPMRAVTHDPPFMFDFDESDEGDNPE